MVVSIRFPFRSTVVPRRSFQTVPVKITNVVSTLDVFMRRVTSGKGTVKGRFPLVGVVILFGLFVLPSVGQEKACLVISQLEVVSVLVTRSNIATFVPLPKSSVVRRTSSLPSVACVGNGERNGVEEYIYTFVGSCAGRNSFDVRQLSCL